MHSEAVPKKTHLRCSSDHPRGHREGSGWSGTASGSINHREKWGFSCWDSQHSSEWDSCWTKCSWQHSPCHSRTWTWTRLPQGSHSLLGQKMSEVGFPSPLWFEFGAWWGKGKHIAFTFSGHPEWKTLSLPWAVPPAACQQCCPGIILYTFWCGSSLHSLPNLLWTSLSIFPCSDYLEKLEWESSVSIPCLFSWHRPIKICTCAFSGISLLQ